MKISHVVIVAVALFGIGLIFAMAKYGGKKKSDDVPNITRNSEDIAAMVGRASKELNPELVEQAARKPPWVAMPGHAMDDPIWRMGSAEDLRCEFFRKFTGMSASEQTEFEAKYPEPKTWDGYYDLLRKRAR